MYSPDGFASLACLMVNQCIFLGWQQPFIELMKLFHGNYVAFFLMQFIVWMALIGSVYFLSKALKVKHLFLTPFLLLFGCSLFVDNYVGGFENDYIAIVLFLVAMVFYFKEKNYLDKWISLALIGLGTSIWMWLGHINFPVFWSEIVEQNWWAMILAWNFLIIPFALGVIVSCGMILYKKDEQHFAKMFLIAFCFPKLWFFAIPLMLKLLDTWLSSVELKPNFLFYMKIIIFALLLGQVLRVGVLTYSSWSYEQSSNCYTVNHEYLARVQGKSINTNQATIYEYKECLKREGLSHG